MESVGYIGHRLPYQTNVESKGKRPNLRVPVRRWGHRSTGHAVFLYQKNMAVKAITEESLIGLDSMAYIAQSYIR